MPAITLYEKTSASSSTIDSTVFGEQGKRLYQIRLLDLNLCATCDRCSFICSTERSLVISLASQTNSLLFPIAPSSSPAYSQTSSPSRGQVWTSPIWKYVDQGMFLIPGQTKSVSCFMKSDQTGSLTGM